MNRAAEQRQTERRRRVRHQVDGLSTLELFPLALEVVKAMTEKQREIARQMKLEELAAIRLFEKDLYGL